MGTTRAAEEVPVLLAYAREQLRRGDVDAAASVLRSLGTELTDDQATQTAELLIAARLLVEATDLAVTIAGAHLRVWPWINRFAGHMRARGEFDAGQRVVRAFIAAHPARSIERLHADATLALGLPSAYVDRDQLSNVRDTYMRQLHEFVSSHPPHTLREIGARADDLARSNFYLAYQGGDDLDAQRIYGDWLAESLGALTSLPPPTRSAAARPRIALVSSKWNECTVGWYFASWVEHLSRSWSVALVHTPGARRDALTHRLTAQCDSDTTLAPSLDAAAMQIQALSPDIILYPELGTDGFTFALAAQRLAAVQACAWGHPVTSGLPTVDVFISCKEMEPDGADAHYRERLVTLPGIGTRYTHPPLPRDSSVDNPRLPSHRPLYLMPQSTFKWHPDTDRQLVEIVRRDPLARFVLFELRPPSPARIVNERLLRALAEVSATPQDHLIWMPECSRAEYLRINQACAVMIDTPHWSGGNATLDALHCGLPVVTLPGRFMRGRQSMGMLRLIGCEELIAHSVEELADIAVAIAHDKPRREHLSKKIAERAASLTQSDEPLIAMEACLRALLENC